jgi:hypothetical protein
VNCDRCDDPVSKYRRVTLEGVPLCGECRTWLFAHPAEAALEYPTIFDGRDRTALKRKRPAKKANKRTTPDPWGGEWSPWLELGGVAEALERAPTTVSAAVRRGNLTAGHRVERRRAEAGEGEGSNTRWMYRAKREK